jgi:hypothetical protein
MGRYERIVEQAINSAPTIMGDTNFDRSHILLPEQYRTDLPPSASSPADLTIAFPVGEIVLPTNQIEVPSPVELEELYSDYCNRTRVAGVAEQQWRIYHTRGHAEKAYDLGAEDVRYALGCYRDYSPPYMQHSLQIVPHGLEVTTEQLASIVYLDAAHGLPEADYDFITWLGYNETYFGSADQAGQPPGETIE